MSDNLLSQYGDEPDGYDHEDEAYERHKAELDADEFHRRMIAGDDLPCETTDLF